MAADGAGRGALGAARTLETPSFRYHFRLNDAQVVTEVATQIEGLYTTLRDNFGLTDTPRVGQPITPTIGQKLAIEVSVPQTPGSARFEPHNYERFVWEDRLIVASPALYLAPVDRTDAELLAQSIALPLLAHVLAEAGEQYQFDATWQPLVKGLRLWQVWDLDLPLATWQEEVVTWVYTGLPNARPDQTALLPEHYTALCASHKLWLPSPMALGIPLLCAEEAWEDFFLSPWGWYDPLTRLDQLSVPLPSEAYIEEQDALRLVSHPGRTVALAMLIEYAVAAYGRGRLPLLVAGLGQHDSWDTLLPAVYGVSPAAFEAGWQTYLVERYGVTVTNK